MTTAFQFTPAMSSQAAYDSYTTADSFDAFTSSADVYPTMASGDAYMHPQFATTMTAFPTIASTYSDAMGTRDSYFDVHAISGPANSHIAFSPAQSPAEHLAAPRLSASSESGASVQSTSSSAIGSPHMHPQYTSDGWNSMVAGNSMAMDQHDMSTGEMYFQTTMDTDPSKVGFVGESKPLDSSSQSSISFHHRNPVISVSPSTTFSNRASFSSSPFSHPASPLELPTGLQADGHFKSPGLPASAIRSSSYSTSPPSRGWTHVAANSPPIPRRSSLLSNQLYLPQETLDSSSSPVHSLTLPAPFSSSSGHVSPSFRSCSFIVPHFLPSAVTNNQLADPSILNGINSPLPYGNFPDLAVGPPSPAFYPDPESLPARPGSTVGKAKKSPRQTPYQTYPTYPYNQRRQSTSSSMSRTSTQRSQSFDMDDLDRERGVCPIPECGKSFKDLKAHMLTHQNERPEKCPISTCEYHTKGFARKYDKNRHTLTHYKGTMVCGFCPGSGSSAEKSFNRADVFKRHLTSVHGVEQVPPNARRKSPIARKTAAQGQASGTCSTCSVTFPSAQEFYEHLDDCVLRVVQQIDPAEAINQKHLQTIAEDREVKDTLEKHHLTNAEYNEASLVDDDDDEDDEEDSKGSRNSKLKKEAGAGTSWQSSSGRISKKGRPGLTLSKGGVRLAGPPGGGRKKRKNYPASWGCSPDKMKMKKRVLCVYDGTRRLWKDDLMLDSEFEVRVPLPPTDNRAAGGWVTDLDIQTLRRADAIFSASEEERGPWVPDNILLSDEEGQLFV